MFNGSCLINKNPIGLEREVRALKGRYRLDAALEKLTEEKARPRLVPISLLDDMTYRLKELDTELKNVKAEAYKAQVDFTVF